MSAILRYIPGNCFFGEIEIKYINIHSPEQILYGISPF